MCGNSNSSLQAARQACEFWGARNAVFSLSQGLQLMFLLKSMVAACLQGSGRQQRGAVLGLAGPGQAQASSHCLRNAWQR